MREYSRYERQYILKEIGKNGQRQLERACVAVVGLGALGSVSANLLTRAGIGTMRVIDRDFLEMNNLQRQVLYDEKDIQDNLPKAVAAQRKLQQINSEIKIESYVSDINANTIDEVLENVDVIIDGTDNFETRFLLNDYALCRGIPWVYGGAVATEGMSYVTLPHEGPCLRCLFGQAPSPENAQTCDRAGILAPVAHLIASFQTVEAIKIIAGKWEDVENKLWKVDIWSREFRAITVEHLKHNPCPGCSREDYPFLKAASGLQAVSLCGRNAVQITQSRDIQIGLKELAGKLTAQGDVTVNDYLLRCRLTSHEITVFLNGRAIVKGTEDPGQAKSLYAKYVGA